MFIPRTIIKRALLKRELPIWDKDYQATQSNLNDLQHK
jgi:hypothetical protein